jgi:hypothetical protein
MDKTMRKIVARRKKSARHRLAIFRYVDLIGSLESPPSN